MTTTLSRIIRLVAALALAAAPCWAQIPQKLSLQGNLTATGGAPVTSTLSMTFSLWDQAEGGTQAWTETQSVTVANGLYNVLLGSVSPLAIAFDKPYYLEIQVAGDTPMTPRRALASVAYAANAAATACQTNDIMPCYSGPAATLNVGACKAGRRFCDPVTKTFGACTGQVLPVTEIIGNGIDDDCNGVVQ